MASPPRPRRSNKKATGVTIQAAKIMASGAIIAAIVGALITGIVLYLNNQLSSPKPIPSATTAATGTVIAACAAAPTLTGPADGQTLNSRTVTLTWEAPQGCLPDGYTVRISADYDPEAKPWIVDTGWAPTDYTYTFSADGTYYWHIRACKPCTPFHPGNWAIRSFTIHSLQSISSGVITAVSGHSSLFQSWVRKNTRGR